MPKKPLLLFYLFCAIARRSNLEINFKAGNTKLSHQLSLTEQSFVKHIHAIFISARSIEDSHHRFETVSVTVSHLTLVFALILLGFGSFFLETTARAQPTQSETLTSQTTPAHAPSNPEDLSGLWEIQEEDRTYQAILDSKGNGPYTHEQGSFTTTELDGQLWSGTWQQKGNDREGEFEVLLSEDYRTAEGDWWYTRVEEHKNIPPRIYGGSYFFKRLDSSNDQQTKHE